jgi:Zn-dependent protease
VTPWGSGRSGAGRRLPDQRTLIIVAVAVVLGVVVAASHRISSAQLIYFLVLVPSIIIHEISHGAVALAFGDSTAKRAGRLNLNPLRHIDPVGTLLVPAVLSLSGLGAYGWAKPVPVNAANLRSPRNHIVFVSLVGPFINFVLAALLGVVFVATGGSAILERLLPARLLPGYWNLQPVLMFLPFLLILVFRGPWSDLVNHLYQRWVTTLAG